MRKLIARILSQLGHRVLEADGPEAALLLAAATPTIDLLLTDFLMPEANGLELAEKFRAFHPNTPVLMVSGSLEAVNHRGSRLDRFAVLAKPFTSQDLLDEVRLLLADGPGACPNALSQPDREIPPGNAPS